MHYLPCASLLKYHNHPRKAKLFAKIKVFISKTINYFFANPHAFSDLKVIIIKFCKSCYMDVLNLWQ